MKNLTYKKIIKKNYIENQELKISTCEIKSKDLTAELTKEKNGSVNLKAGDHKSCKP